MAHTLQPPKGDTALELSLPKETKEVWKGWLEEGQGLSPGWGSAARAPEKPITGAGLFSDTFSGHSHCHPSTLVFQQPSLLKRPFLPSGPHPPTPSTAQWKNYQISQLILCCIQNTKLNQHNLLSPGPAPTTFFLLPILTSPICLLWFNEVP